MKNKIIVFAAVSMLLFASCDTYYQVNSVINKDGSMYRETFANADSSKISQKQWNKIFVFDTEEWNIGKTDSVIKYRSDIEEDYLFNVVASRTFDNIDGVLFKVGDSVQGIRNIFAPEEKVKRRFCWFYTCYYYSAIFNKMDIELPVNINKYLTPEEQHLWFDETRDICNGTNGIETYMMLSEIQNKFDKWINHCQFSISLNIIRLLDSIKYGGSFQQSLAGKDDLLFNETCNLSEDKNDYSVNAVCESLDKYFDTTYFSILYSENMDYANVAENEKSRIFDVATYHQKYILTMPGKIYKCNMEQYGNDNVEWDVDAYRLMNNDIVITVKSKTINYWAFAVTIIILILPVVLFKRKNTVR